MKFNISLLLVIIVCISCGDADVKSKPANTSANPAATDSANFTTIQWLDSAQNLGTLTFGENKAIRFNFVNNGDKPLYIISVAPSCGCTVAEYPQEAIAPGKGGTITAGFDTNKGSEGEFRKSILVNANTKGQTKHTLFFTGTIKKEGTE